MKLLIVGSDLKGLGGVQNYYRLILPLFPEEVDYFPIGRVSRSTKGGARQALEDLLLFRKKMIGYDAVILNASLCARCFFRDILILLYVRKKDIRIIIFFHGWRQTFEASVDRWFLPIFKRFYNRVDAMVVLSSKFELKLHEWGYLNPIYLERTVVDDSWFYSTPSDRSSHLILSILFLSRVEDYKGIYELADGLAQLPAHSFECILAGDGSELPAFKKYVKEQGYDFFQFPGYLTGDEKRRAYRDADLYILPSHTEGMPCTLLEAMASGLPCVVSAVGGIPDFFEDGNMGVLLKEISPEAIAAAVITILEKRDKLVEVGHYNRKYASEHFRATGAAKRLAQICLKTLEDDK